MAKKKSAFVKMLKKKKLKVKRKLKKQWLKQRKKIILLLIFILLFFIPVDWKLELVQKLPAPKLHTNSALMLEDVHTLSFSEPYVILNDNIPLFEEKDYTITPYESYSELDWLGRCGVAMACIGTELMPIEERGSIGQIKPSGWHTVRYDIVDGKYLYNRCHLIGYQLTGENANEKNLITGTRYMNIEGMLPFEDMVATYVRYTGRHVMYRVTPVYQNYNLVATGVTIEGYSVEDDGAGICFYVFVPNIQPGIVIDYTDGSSQLLTEGNRYKE